MCAPFSQHILNIIIVVSIKLYSRVLKIFLLLRIIAIQSSPDEDQKDKNATLTLQDSSSQDNGVNLFILAGHEAMQLWLVKLWQDWYWSLIIDEIVQFESFPTILW